MGLDMYLNNKKYIGANYSHNEVTGNIELYRDGKKIDINLNKVSYITERVAQWYKANAIHNWFVENVQEGEDDCKEYYVSLEQLECLLDDVNQVLGNKALAESILPTTSGFFFGNTEYDEYYFENLKYTKKILDEIIQNKNLYQDDLYYSSSW